MDPRLSQVLTDVLGVDVGMLKDVDSPASIPQWDSVRHLQLLMALEVEFGMQFSPDEMAQLNTIGLIRDRIARLGA